MEASGSVEKPIGILHPHAGAQQFHVLRYPPASDLALFVERFWIVQWDMRGHDPYLQTTLPHPCVNLVIEPERTGIYGVATQVFSYLLREQGRVFGIKFRPGGFYPFLKRPIIHLTDSAISIRDAFGTDCTALVAAFAAQADAATLTDLTAAFVRAHLPAPDDTVTHINQIIDTIIANRAITRVDEVAHQFGTTPRTLQRLFRQYVGVSPKWVIKRYRLHDAAGQLADGGMLNWPKLAVDLGYFDQAHFINDFKALIGTTPAAYAQQNGAPDQAISQRQ